MQNQFSKEKIVHLSNLPKDLKISFQQEINLRSKIVLADICNIFFGMKPYQIGKGNPNRQRKSKTNSRNCCRKNFNSSSELNEFYYKLIGTRHIKRYESIDTNEWIKYGEHLAEPRNIVLFQNEHLLLQRIISSETIRIFYAEETLICNTDVMTIKIKKDVTVFCDLKFLMGILASRLICWRLKSENINLNRNAFPKVNINDLSRVQIPFLLTQPFNNKHRSWHDRIVQLVEQMLALHKQLAEAKTPPQKSMIQK